MTTISPSRNGRPRVLCFASYYLPGFRAGGPVRSLAALCDWLGADFAFDIVTRDHDLGSRARYPERVPGGWYETPHGRVWHLETPYWSPAQIRQVVAESKPDILYFHSFLDPELVIMPLVLRRLGLLPRRLPVVVAPRGEFSPQALALKAGRKRAFLGLARVTRLYDNVTWQATDPQELEHIRREWGAQARVLIAPNLPPRAIPPSARRHTPKPEGELRVVFLARIARMKNLDGALRALARVTARVSLDIYGTREDPAYWTECEALIAALPANVRARYLGVVAPGEVIDVMAGYDAFLLPSRGENFGHAILEALLAGCPPLLSDRTPWRNLAGRAIGFDTPLDDDEALAGAIDHLAALPAPAFEGWTARARAFGVAYCEDPGLAGASRTLLTTALAAA